MPSHEYILILALLNLPRCLCTLSPFSSARTGEEANNKGGLYLYAMLLSARGGNLFSPKRGGNISIFEIKRGGAAAVDTREMENVKRGGREGEESLGG